MSDFVGRRGYMATLKIELERVRQTGRGRLVSMRGPRRVGKSRLLDEFLRRGADLPVPYVFFTTSKQALSRQLEMFEQDIARSELPAADVVRSRGVAFESWDGALTLLATTAGGMPQVIVIDEFPYLVEQDPSLEATLQKVWDRHLRKASVLLVLIGSDISMMSALTEYDRPLYGRLTLEMVVEPFGTHETAEMLDLPAADAIEAQLVLGGFPQITQEWRPGTGMWDFLDEQLSNPTSPLIVGGERILSAEFQEEARARQVLETIGSGERTFTTIQRRADIHETTLQAGDASNHEPEARRVRGLDQLASEKALRRSRPGAHRGATRRGPQNGRRYRPGRRLQRGIRRARQRSRRGPRSRVPAESVCRGCCQVPGTEGQDYSH